MILFAKSDVITAPGTSQTRKWTSFETQATLASEQYAEPGTEKKITVVLSSKLTGVKEGPAVLRVSARDRSLWNSSPALTALTGRTTLSSCNPCIIAPRNRFIRP
jgi:hypothetical protein